MGQHNRYTGDVLEYRPVGTGSVIVSLTLKQEVGGHEFDEDNVEFYGEIEVLAVKPKSIEELEVQTQHDDQVIKLSS